jgi:RNase H-like domain found in reverse transcriptase
MKNDKKFKWNTNCQEAFDTMKKQFMEEPVLLMPNQSKPFQIKSDTSKVATGMVLTQLDLNGD